jgi:hypothetical protein
MNRFPEAMFSACDDGAGKQQTRAAQTKPRVMDVMVGSFDL